MDGEVTFITRDWNKVQNAQETDFPSSTWRWTNTQHHQNTRDAGSPITFGVRPTIRYIKNKYPTTATIYRTQGGVPPNASRERISLNENGEVSISGQSMLYVTINDKNHQIYFYYKRGGSEQGVSIASFKIPRALADEIKEAAVPQNLGKSYPNNPQISDPTKSTGAYGLPRVYIDKIQNQAIKGSFKILKPK